MSAGPWRGLLFVAGWVSLALGVIGIFLPLMPTTVFVLLAAWCFARSSPRFHRWLLAHRWFGPMVRSFRDGGRLPRAVRLRAVITIWLTMGLSMWLVGAAWAVVLLTVIGSALTVYLFRLPVAD